MRSILVGLFLVTSSAFAAAPFPQTFVDVPAAKFTNANLDYYRAKHLGLQTVAYYQKNGHEYVAGSFNSFVRPGWDGYINLDRKEFGEVIGNVLGANYMRQVTARVFAGQPAYTVIFQPSAGWVDTQSTFDLNDTDFNQFMFTMAQMGFTIVDHAAYISNGARLHSAVFQKDEYKRMYYGEYDLAGIQALQTQKNKEQWWIRSLDVYPGANGADVFSVIFHYGADATEAHFAVTAAEFKKLNADYNKRGWDLLQVKESGGKFSGVWCVSVLP